MMKDAPIHIAAFQEFRSFVPRSRFLIVFVIFALATLTEGVGIGLIVPMIQVLSDPNTALNAGFARTLFEFSGLETQQQFSLVLLAVIGGAFLLKNGLAILASYVQTKFAEETAARLSRQMYGAYINAPMMHLYANDSNFVINTSVQVTKSLSRTLIGFMSLTLEGMIVLAISAILLWHAAGATLLAVAALALCIFVLYRRFYTRLGILGRDVITLQDRILRSARNGLVLLKEIRISGRQAFFVDAFGETQDTLAQVRTRQAIYSTAPRHLVESALICGLIVFLAVTLASDVDFQTTVLPLLSLFAVALLRLIPSTNKILSALNQIKFAVGGLERLTGEYRRLKGAGYLHDHGSVIGMPTAPTSFSHSLFVTNVGVTYPGASSDALSNISISITPGQSIAFVGPSGSGKTTLLNTILGLLEPSTGTVLIDGKPLAGRTNLFGYVPQDIVLLDDSLKGNIAIGEASEDVDEARVRAALKQANLESVVDELEAGVDTIIGENGFKLSGGQRQRVAIARALYNDPPILVFDEATAALDSQTEREIMNTIDTWRSKKTIIIVAHRLSTVRNVDTIFVLENGSIRVSGSFDDLLKTDSAFARLVALSGVAHET